MSKGYASPSFASALHETPLFITASTIVDMPPRGQVPGVVPFATSLYRYAGHSYSLFSQKTTSCELPIPCCWGKSMKRVASKSGTEEKRYPWQGDPVTKQAKHYDTKSV
jgi:hypothetical protein